jgi:hypothetical protein
MGNQRTVPEVDPDLQTDARWQLIERIVASPPFQKSTRLRELLCFLAEKTLHGQIHELTEHGIGSSVFGKAQDYSVVEDSSVRVHIRQLRLKLLEYFDGEGRDETVIVEIPKGAYTALFRNIEQRTIPEQVALTEVSGHNSRIRLLPWVLAAVFSVTTLAAWFHRPAVAPPPGPLWPVTTLFDANNHPVQIVVADVSYGMTRLADERQITLEEYLSPAFRSGQMFSNEHPTPREERITKYLSTSLLTSYADLVAVSTLLQVSGSSSDLLVTRSARELRPRDLEEGSFVFVGSPSSNPWVSYFQDKLNFQEREGIVGGSFKYFQNLHPNAGEQQTYQGLAFTGSSGEDYATISLLPAPNGHGGVLILQGLQQEGTEAAALFLADAGDRQKLQQALGISGATPTHPVYFEVLIQVQAVAGSPNATSIVAIRKLHS